VDPREAKTLARTILDDLELPGWSIKFDRAVKRFGRCTHGSRTISLSTPLVKLNDRAAVEDTIRHEAAHALVGPYHGHDTVWRRECVRVGAKPDAKYEASDIITPDAPWTFTCPSGCAGKRYRKPTRALLASARCRRHNEPVTWKKGS